VQHRFRVGEVVALKQQAQQVVGIDNGIFRNPAQPVGAKHTDVGIGPDQHGEVSIEIHHPADAFRAVVRELVGVALFDDNRYR